MPSDWSSFGRSDQIPLRTKVASKIGSAEGDQEEYHEDH